MEFQRTLVADLVHRLGEPRQFIQIVVGPRQTGKTTAVNQALSYVVGSQNCSLEDFLSGRVPLFKSDGGS